MSSDIATLIIAAPITPSQNATDIVSPEFGNPVNVVYQSSTAFIMNQYAIRPPNGIRATTAVISNNTANNSPASAASRVLPYSKYASADINMRYNIGIPIPADLFEPMNKSCCLYLKNRSRSKIRLSATENPSGELDHLLRVRYIQKLEAEHEPKLGTIQKEALRLPWSEPKVELFFYILPTINIALGSNDFAVDGATR